MELTAANLIKFFASKIKLFLVVIPAGAVLSLAYTFIQPAEYRSFTTIIPPDDQPSGISAMFQSLPGISGLGGSGGGSRSRLYGEILQSREIATFISDSLKMKDNAILGGPNPVINVMSSIGTSVNKNGVLTLYCGIRTGWFPSRSEKNEAKRLTAVIANTAVAGLNNYNREKSVSKAKRKLSFIENVLTEKRRELDSLDRVLELFRRTHKLIEIESQAQTVVSGAVSVGSELARAQFDLRAKESEYGDHSPLLQVYRDRVNNLKAQYDKTQRGGFLTGDNVSIPLDEVPSITRQYVGLIRDQKILEQVNIYLESQRQQEAIQAAGETPAIEQLDTAIEPTAPSSPHKMTTAVFGTFLISLLTAIWLVGKAVYDGALLLKKSGN